MGGDRSRIPDMSSKSGYDYSTGAGKYWYVDPRAGKQRFDPMENYDEQGHQDLPDALARLGLLPEGTNPSF